MTTTTTSSPEQFLAAWERSLDPRASAEANLAPAPTRVPDHVLDFFSAQSAPAQPAPAQLTQPAPKRATAAPSGRGSALPDPTSTSIDQVAQSLKRTSLSMTKTASAPPSSSSSAAPPSSVFSPPSTLRAASTTVASATRKSSPPSDDEHDDDDEDNVRTHRTSKQQHSREQSDNDDDGDDDGEGSGDDEERHNGSSKAPSKKSKAAAAAKLKKEQKAAAKAEVAAQEARKQQILMWLDNPDFYWQVQKIDAVTKVGFAKHHVSWRFVIGTELHELDLSHSPISGKRVIRLDGSEIVNEKTALEGQASHRVRIGSTMVEVTLVSNGWGLTSFAYELYVNHQPFEQAKKDWQIMIRNQLDAMGAINPAPSKSSSPATAARKK